MVPLPMDRRRGFLDLALRRRRPAHGRGGEAFLLRGKAEVKWPDLTQALGSIPWAVCGAVATRLYMPERATADLDVIVLLGHGPAVRRALERSGFVRRGDLAIGGSTWESPEGVQIDLLERNDPWLPKALAAAAANRDPQGLPILPLPYLVLTKLQASRVQDLADLARMLGGADAPSLGQVRAAVKEYAPGDLDDLESLIELGRLEQGEAQG